MYSNPIYYLLLLLSFISFITFIWGVYQNKKRIHAELVDLAVLDNRAYWVYNNKLYYAKVENNTLDNKTISTVDTFGMNAEEAYKIFKEKQW